MHLSIFDIAGPIMVGPSSSHTAGAVKLGQIARALFHGTPITAEFHLYGSFAEVAKGHATDRALLAGVMKFRTKDLRLKDAFKIAKQKNLKYKFIIEKQNSYSHSNTVKIYLENKERCLEMTGSSVGGGNIAVTNINGSEVHFTGQAGKYFSIIVSHENKPEVFAAITPFLTKLGIGIINIQTSLMAENGKVIRIFDLDNKLTLEQVKGMEKLKGIEFVRAMHKVSKAS